MDVLAPLRVAHRGEIHLQAPPERAFLYLCPVRETEYVPGWDPSLVLSQSGLAEEGCVFVTGDGDERAVWTYVEHDPSARALRLLKVTPASTVCDIHMRLEARAEGRSRAAISYAHTALTPAGEAFCRQWDAAAWSAFLERFEGALNARLARPESEDIA